MSRGTHEWTRREWLQATAAGAVSAAAAGSRTLHAAPLKAIGVQLYTVRDQMKAHAAETLKAIADIGYKELEVLRVNVREAASAASRVGLTSVSMHIDAPLVTGDWTARREAAKLFPMALDTNDTLDAAIQDAKATGISYLTVSYLFPGERKFEPLADAMNKAGERVAQAGLQLCYHNHGFEFEKQPDGRTGLDTLMSRLDRTLVKLEMDVFWVAITGADPVALLQQYSGRVALVHLKDKSKGAPRTTDERKVPPTAFAEVGSGTLDFPAILKAADAAGVEHYFVEQDHTPGDPLVSLKKSYTYLQHLT
jgi:sugar phosphate isomerase/epimerase